MKTIFYVSPDGNDRNKGTIEQPFCSLERALEAVYSVEGDTAVYLRGGEYYPVPETVTAENGVYPLRKTKLVFYPDERERSIEFSAYENETPVICGDMRLTDWELYDEGKRIYRAACSVETRQLFADGKRANRIRVYGKLEDNTEFHKECRNGGYAYITADDEMTNWKNPDCVELVYNSAFTFPRCCMERAEILEDGRTGIVMKQPGFHFCTHKGGTSVSFPAYIENVFEYLQSPGEFYCDKYEKYIYYIPEEGKNPNNMEITVPVTDVLLTVRGESAQKKVKNISFRGITFQRTGWVRPGYSHGHCDTQNNHIREERLENGMEEYPDYHADAAIIVEYASNISFTDCKILHTGITGIRITKCSQTVSIRGTEVGYTAGSAVAIGDPQWRKPENRINFCPETAEETMQDICVENCYLHDVGLEYKSASALSVSYAVNTTIAHNDIVRCPYTAVHLGYGWAEVEQVCTKDLHFKNNLIDGFMLELFDGGGVYTLGQTGGTEEHPNLIEGNVFRNQGEAKFGALYFDEGSSNWTAKNNVFDLVKLWCHVSVICPKNHDISVTNNFISGGHILFKKELEQKNIHLEEGILQDRRSWSAEALDIIEHAGLEKQYAHLRKDYYEIEEIAFDRSDYVLTDWETKKVSVIAVTRRGVPVAVEQVKFSSYNDTVTKVSPGGTLIALKTGVCKIAAETEAGNGNVLKADARVYVNDSVRGIEVRSTKSVLKPGDTANVQVFALTQQERSYPIEDACLSCIGGCAKLNGAVLCALENGTGSLAAKAKIGEDIFQASSGITVSDEPTGDILSDERFWENNADSELYFDRGVKLCCDKFHGFAYYAGKTFADREFRFSFRLKASHDWPCIVMRAAKKDRWPTEPQNDAYVIIINDYIEPQRFNRGKRTLFYGSLGGTLGLSGKVIRNTFVKPDQLCNVVCGLENQIDGVRFYMEIDGICVFDYLDTGADRIESGGYFGLVVNNGEIELRNAK